MRTDSHDELSALNRMYSLAIQGKRLQHMPYIAILRESNVRKGFFERDQFEAVRRLRGELLGLTGVVYVLKTVAGQPYRRTEPIRQMP